MASSYVSRKQKRKGAQHSQGAREERVVASGLSTRMTQTWHHVLAAGNPWARNLANFSVLVFKIIITGP